MVVAEDALQREVDEILLADDHLVDLMPHAVDQFAEFGGGRGIDGGAHEE
jgi:hypothetical protein